MLSNANKQHVWIARLGLLVPVAELTLLGIGFITENAGFLFLASIGILLTTLWSVTLLGFMLFFINQAKKQGQPLTELVVYASLYALYTIGILCSVFLVNASRGPAPAGATAYRTCNRGYYDCIERSSDGSACILMQDECLATLQRQGQIPAETINITRLNDHLEKLKTQRLVDNWTISDDRTTLLVRLGTESVNDQEIDQTIQRLLAKLSLPLGGRSTVELSPRTELSLLYTLFVKDRYTKNTCVDLLTRSGEFVFRDCFRNE